MLLFSLTWLLSAPLAGQVAAGPSSVVPEVVATGHAEVRLRPDRASLTLAVVTRADAASEASQANAERVLPLLEALRRQGLTDSLISTSGFTVSEDQEYDFATDSYSSQGFVARNAVRVLLLDPALIGAIIDTALLAGATEVSAVTFASSEAADGRRRAIAAATLEARADAEAAAASLGGRLGPVIEVVVEPVAARFPSGFAMQLQEVTVRGAGAAAMTPILVGDLTTSAQVRLRAALDRGGQ